MTSVYKAFFGLIFLRALGNNVSGNKQLWLGDVDYAGNAAGTFIRYTVSNSGSAYFDAVAGDGSVRRPLQLGVGSDANAAIVLGADEKETAPGSFVWDYNNMSIGNGYRANAAPSNGLIVQGSTGIGAASFNATYPEKFLVDAGTSGNTNYQNVIIGKGNTNSYAQLNIQNSNAGSGASSDVVATANNGNETSNYIDMGINGGSNNSGAMSDAYLFYNLGQNLFIGTGTAGKSLIFLTGGTNSATNGQMIIDGNGNVGTNTQTHAAVLDVSGTAQIGTNGSVLNNIFRTTVKIGDATTIATSATKTYTATVTNANLNATVMINPRSNLPGGIVIACYRISAPGTLTVGFTNGNTSATVVGSILYDVTIIQ